MKSILNAPWFLAFMALALMLGTQFVALKLSWAELFPKPKDILVIKRSDPGPLHWSFSSEEINMMQRELKERLRNVEERESELDAYSVRLQADRAEIDEVRRQVGMIRDRLMENITQLEASEKKNLKVLAKTYSGLEPDATVSIFKELDDSTVVKILFFMKSDQVAAVLQEMAQQNDANGEMVRRAAKLSDMLRLFTDNSQNNLNENI